jgi:hypothetical protein
MSTALAIRPVSRAPARFGWPVPDLVALDQVLIGMEHGYAADRRLDQAIYEALGWDVDCVMVTRRRVTWWARSPLSSAWQTLPSPTGDLADARRLLPHGWDWRGGERSGRPWALVEEGHVRDGRDMAVFFEQSRLTVERSLTSAALFAQRFLAREAAGHVV